MAIWEFMPVTQNLVFAICAAWMHVHDSVLPFPLSAQCREEFSDEGRK